MPKKDIKVPNIGEFKDVEVIEILIKKGQEIKKNDPLITIESDKSSVEIPSLHDGLVTELNLKVGDKVSEGSKILEIELKDNNVETKEIHSTKKENIKENKIEIQKEVKPKNIIVKDFSKKTSWFKQKFLSNGSALNSDYLIESLIKNIEERIIWSKYGL